MDHHRCQLDSRAQLHSFPGFCLRVLEDAGACRNKQRQFRLNAQQDVARGQISSVCLLPLTDARGQQRHLFRNQSHHIDALKLGPMV